jgi:phosphate starvation-inducible PhoH-like protein
VFDLMDPDQHIVITTGPAGTGKTYLAMLAAIKSLREHQCDRIVLTRPAIGVEGESHGFLPGNIVDKMEPWTRPLLDVLREHYRNQEIANMIDAGIIEISPLAYMRGRTFKNAWIIADEMQNATPAQVKMLLTRIGSGSRVVVTGDVEQADRNQQTNGLLDVCARLHKANTKGIAMHAMTMRDIQRHPIIDVVLDLYQE